MSQKKAGGSTRLGRDSISKRLGVKIFGNQKAKKGSIIIRQRGTKVRAGENTKRCGDDTIMALKDGVVEFVTKKVRKFTGKSEKVKYVNIK
ncbi:MAG: 50S ribosomal protein L27 [Candidatus Moranbacteria bacterium]|nr:50S ribosomal protein L27 [Candidatus Moranbacteria bacterium]